MAEQPKAPSATPTQQSDLSAEVSRLRKENAELTARIDAHVREAELMRAALDTARDEGRIGGLPKSAVQLAESFTIVQDGPKDKDDRPTTKLVDARPGDVLLPHDAKVDAIRKNLPAGVRTFVVASSVIAEARDRNLARA